MVPISSPDQASSGLYTTDFLHFYPQDWWRGLWHRPGCQSVLLFVCLHFQSWSRSRDFFQFEKKYLKKIYFFH